MDTRGNNHRTCIGGCDAGLVLVAWAIAAKRWGCESGRGSFPDLFPSGNNEDSIFDNSYISTGSYFYADRTRCFLPSSYVANPYASVTTDFDPTADSYPLANSNSTADRHI